MTDSTVYISDYKSLVRLKDALDYCGDSLLKLLKDIDAYIQKMLEIFEKQKDYFVKLLEKAEENLQKAQEAYRRCLDSQREDEDGNVYPSCDSQRSDIDTARQYKDDCKRKLDIAERIISETKHEISEYKFRTGALRPNGGEVTLEYIAEQHTDEAINKMDEILDVVVKEYLGRTIEETYPNETLPCDKVEKFQKAAEEVKKKQKEEANYNQIASAEVSMVCAGCKRPLPICLCAREYQRSR
ncbi:MAG: hypothetical protein FWH18_06115 [Marinilabiliaceae bacterium]|nr:hypothetical protein [Marinilabiliaceae bacterium]